MFKQPFELLSSVPVTLGATSGANDTPLYPTADILCLATHPTRFEYTVGLASGHVVAYQIPDPSLTLGRDGNENGNGKRMRDDEENGEISTPTKGASKKVKVVSPDSIPSRPSGSNPVDGSSPDSPTPKRKGKANGAVLQASAPALSDDSSAPRRSSLTRHDGDSAGVVEVLWQTRRHKGSCGALAYSLDGKWLFSAGSDGLIKVADSTTGRVVDKILVVRRGQMKTLTDPPTTLRMISDTTLAVGTESSTLIIYKLVQSPIKITIHSRPLHIYHPHNTTNSDDRSFPLISSITPLPPSATSTSNHPRQIFTTGGTSTSVHDIISKTTPFTSPPNPDIKDEYLTSTWIPPSRERNKPTLPHMGVVAIGDAEGRISFFARNAWDISLRQGPTYGGVEETVDVLFVMPDTVGSEGPARNVPVPERILLAGMGDGKIATFSVWVRLSHVSDPVSAIRGGSISHDDEGIEGVVGIGWVGGSRGDGRLVTAGGGFVRIWGVKRKEEKGESSEEDEEMAVDEDGGDQVEEQDVSKKTRKAKKGKKMKQTPLLKVKLGGLD